MRKKYRAVQGVVSINYIDADRGSDESSKGAL
jgi:hypothetical protein